MDTPADCAVEYTLTEDDLVDFQEYTLRRRGLRAWIGLFILPLIGAVIGALAVAKYLDALSVLASRDALKGIIFIAVFWGGVIWVRRGSAFRHAVRRRLRDGTYANHFKLRSIEFRVSEIVYSSAVGSGTMPWSAVSDIAVSDTALYLYTSSSQALIIPSRAFDAGAFKAFANRARELWGAATQS